MPPTEEQSARIIELLKAAYCAELETVSNYLAHSINLDGVRSEQIKSVLQAEVAEELTHAQQLAGRIKTIGGSVPGSLELTRDQQTLQPPEDSTDVVAVIRGVIDAEQQAIAGYEALIEACDGVDYVTQDLAITLMGDEQEHLREFRGFLKEYERS